MGKKRVLNWGECLQKIKKASVGKGHSKRGEGKTWGKSRINAGWVSRSTHPTNVRKGVYARALVRGKEP